MTVPIGCRIGFVRRKAVLLPQRLESHILLVVVTAVGTVRRQATPEPSGHRLRLHGLEE